MLAAALVDFSSWRLRSSLPLLPLDLLTTCFTRAVDPGSIRFWHGLCTMGWARSHSRVVTMQPRQVDGGFGQLRTIAVTIPPYDARFCRPTQRPRLCQRVFNGG